TNSTLTFRTFSPKPRQRSGNRPPWKLVLGSRMVHGGEAAKPQRSTPALRTSCQVLGSCAWTCDAHSRDETVTAQAKARWMELNIAVIRSPQKSRCREWVVNVSSTGFCRSQLERSGGHDHRPVVL